LLTGQQRRAAKHGAKKAESHDSPTMTRGFVRILADDTGAPFAVNAASGRLIEAEFTPSKNNQERDVVRCTVKFMAPKQEPRRRIVNSRGGKS